MYMYSGHAEQNFKFPTNSLLYFVTQGRRKRYGRYQNSHILLKIYVVTVPITKSFRRPFN